MVFSPINQAQAGFLEDLLGTSPVSASNNDASNNSQNMSLLQANVSSISILSDKDNDKKDSKAGSNSKGVDPKANINIDSDNALVPATSPLGVSDGTDDGDISVEDVSVYVVRKGDTVSGIAKLFGVSDKTILWANDLKKGSPLVEGDTLIILPVSGVKHTVIKGQTLKSIAKLYKADVSDIASFNGISETESLDIGDELIIPDGVKAEENDKPIKNVADTTAKAKKYYETHPIKNYAGYYINPVPGARLSQGLHDRNLAVDLAIAKGTPIHASAEGTVIFARMGYNGGYGGLVIIAHPNGTQTYYAHQSKVIAKVGDSVYQGQIIGLVGSTGRSTGPHVHFEVRGARNPGADGSWKY